MSEIAYLLRLLTQGDKEAVVTAVNVTDVATKFTSQLAEGYSRKHLNVYNNSNSASGECFYGFSSGITREEGSQPLPKGEKVLIPVSTDIDIYFVSCSGEIGDLRVEEVS